MNIILVVQFHLSDRCIQFLDPSNTVHRRAAVLTSTSFGSLGNSTEKAFQTCIIPVHCSADMH